MTIKKRESITARKCAKLIKSKFKMEDRLIIYNENPAFPYDEGWAMDTAECIIKNLEDLEVFPDDTKYHFHVGLEKINTYIGYY